MTRTEVSGLIVAALSLAMLLTISLPVPISARECTSLDIRNTVDNFNKLQGCTVIRGYLMIVLIKSNVSASDYSNLTFPDLREITDFFILYDLKGLVTFRKLLPNLTVIRGRRLFLNYALTVSSMPDLIAFDFKSLIAIQRGNVYVAGSPKLCFLEHVNWDRLTLSYGENVILPIAEDCPETDCTGCESGYCWSNMVCQKLENDNVANLVRGSLHCHSQCLGGCYNTTNTGCVVCKGITEHGACVTECPSHLYYSEHHERCYTQQECGEVRGYVFENQCNRRCPSGYNSSRRRLACIKCEDPSQCVKTCNAKMFNVFDLAGAEALKDCVRLNSSLYIQINDKVDESNFVDAFENLREVQGYIKIVRSPYLRTLNFLQNLKVIEGVELDNNTYALLIYDNDNLEELWTTSDTEHLRIVNGGINIYSNLKLCNKVVQRFTDSIVHDKEKDLLEKNDEDVLCSPAILNLKLNQSGPHAIGLTWTRNQTGQQIEILYREGQKRVQQEIDIHVCDRDDWKRVLLFLQDLEGDSSHVKYTLGGLKSFTSYDILIKTFQENSEYSARSVLKRIMTRPERPPPPRIFTQNKTSNSITLSWELRTNQNDLIEYYLLEVYEHRIDLNVLDSRDYCDRPAFVYRGHFDDYEDCCHRMEEKRLDEEFKCDMDKEYPCSVKTKENCQNTFNYGLHGATFKILDTYKEYEVPDLKHYTSYTFFFYGCNEAGCGSYYIHNDKTNYSADADKLLYLDACRIPGTNEYYLQFNEPLRPNGAIVSYTIHFQNTDSSGKHLGDVKCITRKQHEMTGFKFTIELSPMYSQTAVRTTSLAGSELSEWVDIGICDVIEELRHDTSGMGAFSVFLICCIICAVIALSWITYRKRWWRRIVFSMMRRSDDMPSDALPLDDRRMLVERLEHVRVQHDIEDIVI